MRTLFSIFFFLLALCLHSQDEPPPPEDFEIDACPELVHCISSQETYDHYLPWGDYGTAAVRNCGGAAFIQSNFKFEALSKEITIDVTWEPDPGQTDNIKCGIMDACGFYGSCVAGSICEDDGDVELFTDNLIVGHTYIFYVDGCLTYEVDLEITFDPGPIDDFESLTGVILKPKRSCALEFGENTYCQNMTFIPELFGPSQNEIEYLLEHEFAICRGAIVSDNGYEEQLEIMDIDDFERSFDEPGNYTFTLNEIELFCASYDLELVYEFEITTVNEHFGEYFLCEHDLDNWKPEEQWLGPGISEPGYYLFEYENECGCPYYQDITIEVYEEEYTSDELVLCPDDYPFEYFDGYILDYEPDDYELFLLFDEESGVRGYDGDRCDSLIHLTVINENPEDRCSSCDLPLILEKSKIIYCIPFDNGSFDVSGKANRVIPEGVRYDNNGPAGNPLWEVVFDGRGDHIRLPHIDDLNTSGFAFDFQFNKGDDFDNGPVETLISKGDLSKDNMRFNIELVRKTEELFDLQAKFHTSTTEHILTIGDMEIDTWHGTTFVVEEDSISLYYNGELHDQIFKTEELKGNNEDVYLGILDEGDELTNAYVGRMDNFKYWKQKLSGQDVLFLYFPEKQFEVNVDLYMTCCEAVDYEGILINAQNPYDTIIYPESSPTGYDSVFFISYVEIESGPQIVNGMQLDDIIVIQMVSCSETCGTEVSWQLPEAQSFSDLCGISEITSSNGNSIQLDENISYLEVDYVATNNCGHSSQYSFAVELICEYESFIPLAEDYSFEIENGLECDDSETYCISNNYSMHPNALTQGLTEEIEVLAYNDLLLTWTLNGVAQSKMIESQADLDIELVFEEVGYYDICLLSIESACDTKALDYCKTIEVVNGSSIDYGSLRACEGSIASVLPTEMNEELQELVVEANDTGSYKISHADDCGCVNEELVQIELIENEIEMLELEVCEASFPIEIMGELFDNDQTYNGSLLIFRGASEQEDALGESCDSLILLTINVNEEIEVELSAEICEGDNYMGYTESGIYEITGQTDAGCDSTTIIELQVNVEESYFESVTICEGESYNGYEEPGVYTQVYQTENGCDSIVQTEVLVNELSILNFFEVICEGEEFMGYDQTGIYEETYIAQNGCDSLVTVNLTVLEESHPDCITSSTEEVLPDVKVYPNPASDFIFIEVNQADLLKASYKIFDVSGKMFMEGSVRGGEKINLSGLDDGLYMLLFTNGQSQAVRPILKL